jgi:4-amino-4-deoxy-L-arabinose transferase-like glycosyltransferase
VLRSLGPAHESYPLRQFYVAENHIMSNDQVGYITTARWLAETGELRSHLIRPAFVREPTSRYYMPGHYYVLAAGDRLFGPGPVAWRIPGMVSFVVAAVGVFFIGRRSYGRLEGVTGALLFILFPPLVAFAFTAMPQLPFLAAGVLVFAVFAYLPARARPWLVPALLVIPFLLRETGALLLIPMALIVLGDHRRRWLVSSAVALSSFALLSVVLQWQRALGKIPRPLHNFGTLNYENAFPPPSPPLTLDRVLEVLDLNVSGNIVALGAHLDRLDPGHVSLAVAAALAALALVKGARRDASGNRDLLALGAGLLFFVVAAVITTLYTWEFYRGLRAVLFTIPLVAVSLAPGLVSGLRWLKRRIEGRLPAPFGLLPTLLLLGALLAGAHRGSRALARDFDPTAGQRAVKLLESLNLDHRGVLVAPFDVSLDYVLRHYPLRWSFVPRNTRTLRLLAETHPVRTVIMREDELRGRRPAYRNALRDIGLVRAREIPHPFRGGVTLVLFERRPPPREGDASPLRR